MRFRIMVSPSMASDKSVLGFIEDRLIRMPEKLRNEFGLTTGLFLSIDGANGKPLLLQVAKSYREDASKDELAAYISASTRNCIKLDKISKVAPADDILIGCDPEFFLVNIDRDIRISASHFFPHYGDVGSDMGLAELRPRPDYKGEDLTESLRILLTRASNQLNNRGLMKRENIKMIARSSHTNAAAGFHVHFGLPNNLLDMTNKSAFLLARIVNILDYYIGISSIMPEGSEDCLRRSELYSKYGKPGDHRADYLTLEYRVPGGHLLRHPILANGLLSLSIVVMKDTLSRMKKYTNNFTNAHILSTYDDILNIYPNIPSKADVYRCVTANNTAGAIKYVDKIVEDISKMIGYKDHSTPIIDYFNYIVAYLGGKEKFSDNIESNWRISAA